MRRTPTLEVEVEQLGHVLSSKERLLLSQFFLSPREVDVSYIHKQIRVTNLGIVFRNSSLCPFLMCMKVPYILPLPSALDK